MWLMVEGSCELGNEPSGSIKCWGSGETLFTGGVSSRVKLHALDSLLHASGVVSNFSICAGDKFSNYSIA
jgi:hypothetical protein